MDAASTAWTLTVTDADGDVDFVVDTTGDTELSTQQLAARLTAEIAAGDDRAGTVADGAGRFLVITRRRWRGRRDPGPRCRGWRGPVAGPGDRRRHRGRGGRIARERAGEGLRSSSSRASRRVLTRLFPVVRATGLVQNSAANPDLRPALTVDSAGASARWRRRHGRRRGHAGSPAPRRRRAEPGCTRSTPSTSTCCDARPQQRRLPRRRHDLLRPQRRRSSSLTASAATTSTSR